MQNGQDDVGHQEPQDHQTAPQLKHDETDLTPTNSQESQSDDDTPDDDTPDDSDTFPRVYVERLRSKSADYRTAAKEARAAADSLKGELWAARVEATGRLADPTDLPLPDDTDADADTVEAAIDELLQRKPHLAARRAGGDIGQHQQRAESAGDVSLSAMLQRGA